MRRLLAIVILTSSLCADGDYGTFEYKGYVGLDAQVYPTRPDGKHGSSFTLQQQLKLSYDLDDFESAMTLYAQEDSSDLSSVEANRNKRTFIRLDELYGKYNFENDMIFGGRNIRFWGALEVNNIVDTFNTKDFRTDGLDPQKQGAWNVAYTHYFENSELSLVAKLYEEKQKMAAYPYVYYFFPKTISVPTHQPSPAPPYVDVAVSYDANRESTESLYRPTLYLSYSGSTESDYPIDYAVIAQHGYDSQRAFKSTVDKSALSVTMQEEVYLVNKFMTYNTMVVGGTLIKLEGLATDVIDDNVTSIDKIVSDYYQLGFGVEHTLSGLIGDADLGLLAEYYYYNTFEHSDEIATDLNLFQVFQNDLFLGFRYTLNDAANSSLIVGAIIDTEYEEQSYSLKYESRLYDVLNLKLDYAYINPSTSKPTAYALMGTDPKDPTATPSAHQRIGLNLAYHF